MNDPQKKPTPREELEMRLTALLMGELPPEEAAALEAQVAADPALATLQARLRKALELLREASQEPEAPVSATPVQLSAERRTRLLAHFQTPRPKPAQTVKLAQFPRPAQVKEKKRRDWSALIPLGVAATVVGLIAYGLGGFVQKKAAWSKPIYSIADNRTIDAFVDNGSLADGESRAILPTPPPPPTGGDVSGNPDFSNLTASSTSTSVNTPSFPLSSISPAQPRPAATPAPALPPALLAAGGAGSLSASSGSLVMATTAAKNHWAYTVPTAGSTGSSVPERSTIYLGSGTTDVTAITTTEAAKRGFDTDVNGTTSLAKTGAGTLVLGDTNTFTGGTVVNGGTLTLNAGSSNIMGDIAGTGGVNTGTGGVIDRNFAGSFFDQGAIAAARSDSSKLTAEYTNSRELTVSGGVSERKAIDSLEFKAGSATFSASVPSGKATAAAPVPEAPIEHKIPDNAPFAKKSAPVAAAKPASTSSELTVAEKTKGTAQADSSNKPTQPKIRATVEQVKQWSQEAQELYDTGRFALAKKRTEQILNVDPANIAARRFEEKIDRSMSDYGVAAYNETRADAIAKTDLAWARPIRRFQNQAGIEPENASPVASADRIRKKLNSIIIPQVEFRGTTVREAIEFLKKKSVELDAKSPSGEKGTNIVLKVGNANAKDIPGIPGVQMPVKDAAPEALDESNPANTRITVSLKNIPLGEALNYVTGLANMKYQVEPYAIAVFPFSQNTDMLITREWKLPPDLIPNTAGSDGIADRTVAKNWLVSQGMAFNDQASAVYIPQSNRLIVRNTQDQLDRINTLVETKTAEKAEAEATSAPSTPPVPQPEVETRANPFSTFSLNISDVSFKLAAASLEQNHLPNPATVRSEEFINAFDYRDPEPAPGAPLAFVTERARYPFAQNRDLLRFSVKTAAAGRQPGRPLNIVLLLDSSGSMERADRVNIVHEALRVLAAQLQPQDKLSIVTFARTPHLWADGVAGDKVADTLARVSQITPEGGTNLEAALDLGYETALKHYTVGSISRVVLFTDGAANLGDVDPEALTKKVEAQRKKGVALDCFGIGWEGFNDDLLEQLTRNADGRYGFINTPGEAAENFATQLAGALRVSASDVKVQVEFNPRRVKAYRQVGYAKHQLTKEQFRDNTVNAAQIGAAESGNALYVVEIDPRGEGDLATVRVRFRDPGTEDYHEHEWAVPFTGDASPLEQGSSALRLAGAAGAFSEMLANNPYAAEVTSDRLLGILSGVPPIYGADPRPTKLEWMIRQARNLSNR